MKKHIKFPSIDQFKTAANNIILRSTYIGKDENGDSKPVCISFKPYRKHDENYYWLSKEDFEAVRQYVMSLRDEYMDFDVTILTNEILNDGIESYKKIDYKPFEKLNTK